MCTWATDCTDYTLEWAVIRTGRNQKLIKRHENELNVHNQKQRHKPSISRLSVITFKANSSIDDLWYNAFLSYADTISAQHSPKLPSVISTMHNTSHKTRSLNTLTIVNTQQFITCFQ